MTNFRHRLGIYALVSGILLLVLSYLSFAGVGSSLSTKPDDAASTAFTPGYVTSVDVASDDLDTAARQAKDFLDQQAAGNRALLNLDIYQRLASNPSDVLQDEQGNPLGYNDPDTGVFTAYPGLWWDAGQADVANLVDGYFSALLTANADLDAALVIGEFPLAFAQIKARARALDGEQNYFAALLRDPRFAGVQQQLGINAAADLANAALDSSLAESWNDYFRAQVAQRLKTHVLTPIRTYYPDIHFSALGFYRDPTNLDAGVAGSHQARLLNAPADEGGVFAALRQMINQARQLGLNNDFPSHVFFADSEFVAELIYHLNLTNADRLVFVNDGVTEAANQNAATAQLDAELKLTGQAGNAGYTPAFDGLAREDRDYLLSVADTVSGRVWRYTPDLAEDEKVADRVVRQFPATFSGNGVTLTLPGIADDTRDGDSGVWVNQDSPVALACPELAAGEYCVTRFAKDDYPDKPALMEQGSMPVLLNQGGVETLIEENWGAGGPDAGVGADGFLTRWRSRLSLSGGLYQFTIRADDRVRLQVNGETVFERWAGAVDQRRDQIQITLADGEHDVMLEYQDVEQNAAVAMTITRLACVAEAGSACVEYRSDDSLVGFGRVSNIQENDQPNGLQFDVSDLPDGVDPEGLLMKWRFDVDFARGLHQFNITHGPGQVDVRLDAVSIYTSNGPSNQSNVQKIIQAGSHLVEVDYQLTAESQLDLNWELLEAHAPSCDAENLPQDAFCAEYYANRKLEGDPVFAREETQVDHQWGYSGPNENMPTNNFSARWQGVWDFAEAGAYNFYTRTDDGVRLWVDGRLLIDRWRGQAPTRWEHGIWLEAGQHEIKMEYFEGGGNAVAELGWEPVASCETVPENTFCAAFFDNMYLAGEPAAEEEVEAIEYDWARSASYEDGPVDRFSTRWVGDFDFAGGDYNLNVNTDDGVRVWIAGELVLDSWARGIRTLGAFNVPAGKHRVVVEHREYGGNARAKVSWTQAQPCTSIPLGSFCGEYHIGRELDGFPVYSRNDEVIDFQWRAASPVPDVIPENNFSVRWQGRFNFEAGEYRFITRVDDGIRIWLDGEEIISSWKPQGVTEYFADVQVTEGEHEITVQYKEHGGHATAQLRWERNYSCDEVPDNAFCGEFFANNSLSGEPARGLISPQIDFDWGYDRALHGVNRDKFSARWQGDFDFAGGSYRFHTDSDDGIRVWVDDELVIDNWNLAWPWRGRYRQAHRLEAGVHRIRVEYRENWGAAKAKVWWETIPGCDSTPVGGFCGEYFPNRNLEGDPKDIRNDGEIDFDWGGGQPAEGIWKDNFSVRWQGRFDFAGGAYRFHTDSDDGIRVWVGDELVLDNWNRRWPWYGRYQQAQHIEAGEHLVKVEYREFGGAAKAKVWWEEIAGCEAVPTGSFCGEYFPNRNLEGTPKDIRNDVGIDFNWRGGKPTDAIWKDNFSVRWQGDFAFTEGGHEFIVHGDDGIRVWVDDQLIIDRWRYQNAAYRAIVNLTEGTHRVKMEYFEGGGNARAELSWQAASACDDVPDGSFCGIYSNTNNGELFPIAIEQTDAIDFNWGRNSPVPGVVRRDKFDALWKGHVEFEGGMHRFMAEADDQMQVLLNGEALFDFSRAAPHRGKYHALHNIEPGRHLVEVKYNENWGSAKAKLSWEPAADCSTIPDDQFCVAFFNNNALEGEPTDMVMMDAVAMDAGRGAPISGINTDQFSARWIGRFEFDEATYRFDTDMDDGVRVYVDDELIIDGWQVDWRHRGKYRRLFPVTAGEHVIKVEYREAWGNAKANLIWNAVPDCNNVPNGEFCAHYFANRNLDGDPVEVRLDQAIDFRWGSGSPGLGIPTNNFSTRWVGAFNFDAGVYDFTTRTDDGVRLWVGDERVIDKWRPQGPTNHTGRIFLAEGVHQVKMEYFEQGGGAVARLNWQPVITGKPAKLQDLILAELDQSQVALVWQGDEFATYRIYRNGELIGAVDSPAYTDQQVTILQAYQYEVRAVWPDGTESDPAVLQVTIPDTESPTQPTGVSAQAVGNTVELSWVASSDNVAVSAYQVIRNGEQIATVVSNSYTDANVSNATQYNYQLIALDAAGNASSASQSVTVSSRDTVAPDAPLMPLANQVNANSVALSWQAANDNVAVTHYAVLRDGVEIATVTGTRYTDTGLADNQAYRYQVVAVDGAGNRSDASAELNVQTTDGNAPTAPGGLQVLVVGDQRVQLSWTASTDNVRVASYRVMRDGRLLATALVPAFTDYAVEPGNSYTYVVRAQDDQGNLSPESNVAEAVISDICEADQQYFKSSLEPELTQCSSCHTASGGAQNTRFILASGANASERNMAEVQNIAAILGAQTVLDKSIGVVNHGGGAPFGSSDSAGYQAMAEFLRRLDDPASCAREPESTNDLAVDALVMNCASCHGTDGASAGPAIPGIAGMDTAYFAKTMRDYRDGVRYSTIMGRVAKGYTNEQFSLMANYFAALPYTGNTQNTDANRVAQGAELHQQNCAGCHQDQGRSLNTAGMRLAGQWKPYIEATLQDYVHQRSVAPGLMQNVLNDVVGQSDDTALTALAEFYASQGADGIAPETPEAPALAATTQDSITLTWMDGDDDWGVAYYEIYRNGELITTTEWNVFTDLDLAFGTYHYEILAVDAAGNRSEVSAGLTVELTEQDTAPNALTLLDEQQTLRKASLILLGRTPTAEEAGAVDSEDSLRQTLRQMMAGDALQDFAYRAAHEIFLVQGARGLDNNSGFSNRDFPAIDDLSGAQRRDLDWAVRQQPVSLLTHIVNNDRSWAEMLTADYTMVNPAMAQVTNAELIGAGFSGEDDAREMRPARIPQVSARIEQPYPHAGVLSTTAWLSRFPTTATNRNRHRAAMLLKQFMGVDLEALGQRPLDDSANGDYLVPTMENPNCLLCHTTMEPIAGGFMDWGENNRYLQNHNGEQGDFDSLNRAYKGRDYILDHAGQPWYQPGDRWYRDMLPPGYENVQAPGGHRGVGGESTQITDNLLVNPGAESGTEGWTVADGELRVIPAQLCNAEQVPEAHAGSSLFMLGGCENVRSSLAYQDIDLTPYQTAIGQNQAQVMYGAFMRNWSAWRDRPYVYLAFLDAAGEEIAQSRWLNHRQPYWQHMRQTMDVPNNAATLRFYMRGQRSSGDQLDAYIDEAMVKLILPTTRTAGGMSRNLQWLAGELVQDARYAKGGVYFWYRALFKREPLQAPQNESEAGYTAAMVAFNEQDTLLRQIANRFAQDNGQGALNVKDLLVDLVVSPLFRVIENQGLGADEAARYGDWGISRLLTPEELNRKLKALTNTSWRNFDQDQVWRSQMGLFYGGFDGGRFQTQPNAEMNSLMNTIPDRMFMELSCNMVRDEFRLEADQRLLFPNVAATDTPVTTDSLQRVNNLLVNPGAEQGMMAWNVEQGTVRDWSNDYLTHPNGGCRGPGAANGDHYFTVGGICDQQTATASAWQEVDVSQHAAAIDAGTAQAFFGANIRPWSRNNDRVTIRLTFHDANGVLISESAALSHENSAWQPMNRYEAIPAQTRRIRFVMASERLSGTNNDGYVDDAVLTVLTSAGQFATDGERRIRQNLQYLHKHLLDEQLSLDDPEIDRSYNLFREVWDDRENVVDNLYCSLHRWEDPDYTKRSWAAVMMYLLGDARFLYE